MEEGNISITSGKLQTSNTYGEFQQILKQWTLTLCCGKSLIITKYQHLLVSYDPNAIFLVHALSPFIFFSNSNV